MTFLFGIILAVFIGISLGLIGGGGSVLAVPVLVYVMGVAPKPAIAMTLFIVGFVSIIGVIPHWKQGNVNFRTAFIFGAATMLGAFLGAKIATLPLITGSFQMILFAVVVFVAAIFMIKKGSQPVKKNSPGELDISLYPKPICKYCWLWMITEGLGVGLLTGLVGVGGGFAIVPALVLLGNTPMREAIGTSLVIIILNSGAGFIGYLGHIPLNWNLMISFTIAASLGIIGGAYFSRFVKPRQLQRGFGYFLIAVATFVLFQNRNKFYSSYSPQQHPIRQEQHY
ncbi:MULTISPECIES: sulfite exporter TauE/SafE family protein [Fischerella]|uniref:Probable membrane transporter protein n=1 Tax=Fischerella muscicola CCMEE 5323 TaxID=2019572 RepID=A0A2N6K4R3_FISMU|nr:MULTISPECIES: sulfite exporter TauE/SafE family protein [Fischerella]MBD2434951.1 sulfite exporter TauE/SafE family protein [Fischerella sp. FACHB-380]PLZ91209.1 sulfite exporter TauE/SafE family protein [Fischerella muscicola CCMEE 5323]